MSLISAIKHRLGLSVTPANNFVLDASADNGTMKLARESGQDIMTVDAAGKVAFPQMGQSLAVSGYVKLPGGLIIQWGSGLFDNGNTVLFPISFPSVCVAVIGNIDGSANRIFQPAGKTLSQFTAQIYTANTGAGATNAGLYWLAIGY